MNHQIRVTALLLAFTQPLWSAEQDAKIKITKGVLAMSTGDNQFATDLYLRLRSDKPTNLFFSPYSISSALAMTYAGAEGQTKSQMASVLHFPQDDKTLNEAMSSIRKILSRNEKESGFQLRVANRLWGQNGVHFAPPFLDVTKTGYGADLGLMDFKQTEVARKTINTWVEEQTEKKIQDLIKPGVLGPDTRLVLTNAIYFKARWSHEFNKAVTADAPFHLAAGQQVSVPMMQQTHRFRYGESDDVQLLELPYAIDSSVTMMILLPKKKDGLTDLEKQLSWDKLRTWLGAMQVRNVDLHLPKFKMTSEFNLTEQLAAMGMPLAFSDKADFTGMSTEEKLTISAVIHKAFVDVNEEGTEAAAATAVAMRMTAILETAPPVEFRADHPFVFLIRDVTSQSILFIGTVANPKP